MIERRTMRIGDIEQVFEFNPQSFIIKPKPGEKVVVAQSKDYEIALSLAPAPKRRRIRTGLKALMEAKDA